MEATGEFEITESGGLVASGKISVAADPLQPNVTLSPSDVESDSSSLDLDIQLNTADIYKELRLRGYDYGPTFRGILSASSTGIVIVLIRDINYYNISYFVLYIIYYFSE